MKKATYIFIICVLIILFLVLPTMGFLIINDKLVPQIGNTCNTCIGQSRVLGTFISGGTEDYIEIDNNGNMMLYGDARVKKTLQISAGALKAPAVNAPVYVDHGLNGAWEFSKSAEQKITLAFAIRPDMDRSIAPEIGFGWSCPATTGDVVWQIKLRWLGFDEDTSSIIPDTTSEQTITVSGTANGYAANYFTMEIPSETDRIGMVTISRLGNNINDTADDVTHLVGIVVRYTSDKLGDPI